MDLYDRALPQVYGYLRPRCRSEAEAEDVTAEVFLAAVRRPPPELGIPWLTGVARRKLVDLWRREERDRRQLVTLEAERVPDEESWNAQLDSILARQVLVGLGGHHREALTLRCVDGLPVAEVSRHLGSTVHAAGAPLCVPESRFEGPTRKATKMPDPFDLLRVPGAPLRPRPEFAAELRARLAQSVSTTAVINRVETHLPVSDPRAAIDVYERAFGATLLDEPMVMPDGSIGHSELAIGDSVVRVAGAHPPELVDDPHSLGGTTVQLYVTTDDAEELVRRAVAAGAGVPRPVAPAHGSLMAKLRDPFGHNWFVVQGERR